MSTYFENDRKIQTVLRPRPLLQWVFYPKFYFLVRELIPLERDVMYIGEVLHKLLIRAYRLRKSINF